jgi:hypothetical protein
MGGSVRKSLFVINESKIRHKKNWPLRVSGL